MTYDRYVPYLPGSRKPRIGDLMYLPSACPIFVKEINRYGRARAAAHVSHGGMALVIGFELVADAMWPVVYDSSTGFIGQTWFEGEMGIALIGEAGK